MAPGAPAHNHFPFKKWPQSCGPPLHLQPSPTFRRPPGMKAFFCLIFVAVFLGSFWAHGPNLVLLGLNLGPKNLPQEAPRCLPRATFDGKPKTLNFDTLPMVLLDFWCPRGALGGQISLKKWCLETTCFLSVFLNTFLPHMAQHRANLSPRWSQDGPKSDQAGGLNRARNAE